MKQNEGKRKKKRTAAGPSGNVVNMRMPGPNAMPKKLCDGLLYRAFGKPVKDHRTNKVLFAGPRSFDDYETFSREADAVLQKRGVTRGTAEILTLNGYGIDRLVKRYANDRGLCLTVFPSMPEKYGKYADRVRLERVFRYLEKAEKPLIVAFCDGVAVEPEGMAFAGHDRGWSVEYRMIEKEEIRAAS